MSNQPLGVYEMLWDCPYCGTKKLLGKTHRHCPECGAAQDAERRYFPSDDEKVAVKDHVYYGADKHCASCGAASSARAKCCGQCGAPLDGSKEIGRRAAQTAGEGQHFGTGSAKDASAGQPPDLAALSAQADAAGGSLKSRSRTGLIVGIVAAVAVVIGLLLVVFLWKKNVSVEATGHSWERAIHVEEFGQRSQSAWCDQMPGDAYSVSRTQKERSHRDVEDGQTCSRHRVDNGDGTYREEEECKTKYRQEPIYDDYCHYTVDRWSASRSIKASGSSLADRPVWPDASSIRAGTCYGCERESGRSASYTLHLRDLKSSDTYTCDFSQPVWQGIAVGTRYQTRAAVLIRRLDCDHLLSPAP